MNDNPLKTLKHIRNIVFALAVLVPIAIYGLSQLLLNSTTAITYDTGHAAAILIFTGLVLLAVILSDVIQTINEDNNDTA